MRKRYRVYDTKQKKVVDYYNTNRGAFASVRGGNYRHTQEHKASDCIVQTRIDGEWKQVDSFNRLVKEDS